MPFPVASDYDFTANGSKNTKMREALDYAIMQYESQGSQRERLRKLYNAHNGIIDDAEIAAITKFTGKQSKTKYVKYRLGKAKMKLLHGEFLMLPLEPQVRTINQDAKNEKMRKYQTSLAMAYAKDHLEQVRNMGFNVLEGMKIPDLEDKSHWVLDNFKLVNEMIMQVIIDKKIKNEKIKTHFHQNFVDLTIASEVYGRIEKDINGKVTYRVINPKFRISQDSVYDPKLTRTPYMGEKRMMYYHEIVNSEEFNLSSEDKKKLKEIADHGGSGEAHGTQKIGTDYAIPVYTLEWKGFERVVRKTSKSKDSNVPYKTIISKDYYDKNQKSILKESSSGKYDIEIAYRQILWTSSRIGNDIYTPVQIDRDIIQVLNENNIYNVEYNYCGYLFSTTDGERVSIQELIYELERVYDDIRFQINKELKKFKGNVLFLDDAFRPKGKRYIDVMHSIDEHGVVRFNSAAEGNEFGRDMDKQMMQSVNLGDAESLRTLIEQAMNIEQTMDRITGLNENRQGLTKATMTATANENNIQASRSITYDLFFCMTDYMETVLMKMIEKEKLCHDENELIFDETELRYLKVTKDMMFSNYYPYLSDGRMEQMIREKLEIKFDAQINAGMLRTSDVAKFLRESSFAKALKILDEADKELQKIRMEEIQAEQEANMQKTQTDLEIAREDREDKQDHEKELEVLKTEGKKEIVALQESIRNAKPEGQPAL